MDQKESKAWGSLLGKNENPTSLTVVTSHRNLIPFQVFFDARLNYVTKLNSILYQNQYKWEKKTNNMEVEPIKRPIIRITNEKFDRKNAIKKPVVR